jgi:hypothetical protein
LAEWRTYHAAIPRDLVVNAISDLVSAGLSAKGQAAALLQFEPERRGPARKIDKQPSCLWETNTGKLKIHYCDKHQ